LVLSSGWKIEKGVGIVVELAEFVVALGQGDTKLVACGSAATTFFQSGFDFVSVVIGGLPGTVRTAGLPGRRSKNPGNNGGRVANPGGNR
jgi:hypothetical protein